MSNRSLLEISHDQAQAIADDPANFALALVDYLRSGLASETEALQQYGVRVLGMRRASEKFDPRVLEGS